MKSPISQIFIAAFAGAVVAVGVTWQWSSAEPPPFPLDREFASRLSQIETLTEQLAHELASDRVSLEQLKERQTEQLERESSDPSHEPSEQPTVGDDLPLREINPIASLSETLPLALSFAQLIIEGSVAIQGPLGMAFLQELKGAGPKGRLFLSDIVRFSPRDRDREAAVRFLGLLQSPSAIDPLFSAAITDSSVAIRGLAVAALRKIRGPAGRSALQHLLDHELAPPSAQIEAWAGLLEQGHHEITPRLPRLLDRCSSSEEADLFVEALLQYGPHDLLPSIEAGINHSEVSFAMKGTVLRTLLARANRENLGYIKEIFENESLTEELREYAAQLLLVDRGWDPPPIFGQAPDGESAGPFSPRSLSQPPTAAPVEKPRQAEREPSSLGTQEPD